MSAERVGSSVAANRRSAHPGFPGVPWWGAILVAVITTTIGFAVSSSAKELSVGFASMYIIGCIAAVLAVQQSGIFTAVIQPPLILFVAVPGSYFVFHGAEFTGLKDTLINYGYPLIERFPLMFFTAAAVLLIGLVRWYFATGGRTAGASDIAENTAPPAGASALTGLAATLMARLKRDSSTEDSDNDAEPAPARPRRRHSVDRSASAQRRTRTPRSGERSTSSRSRHARPPLDDDEAPRPRRRPSERRDADFESDFDKTGDGQTRRPRAARKPREPREPGRNSRSRRESSSSRDNIERGPSRGSTRFEQYESERSYRSFDEPSSYRPRHGGSEYDRPSRDDRYSREDGPTRDRDSSAHHPISRVRYRGADDEFDDRSDGNQSRGGQSRFESRPRRSPERPSREPDWRYDR